MQRETEGLFLPPRLTPGPGTWCVLSCIVHVEWLVRLSFGTSWCELGRCQLIPWFIMVHCGSMMFNQFHPHVFCKPRLPSCLSAGLMKVPQPSRHVRIGWEDTGNKNTKMTFCCSFFLFAILLRHSLPADLWFWIWHLDLQQSMSSCPWKRCRWIFRAWACQPI